MKKIIITISLLIALKFTFDVNIDSHLYEDGSGRATITYCIPLQYCE